MILKINDVTVNKIILYNISIYTYIKEEKKEFQ